MNQPLNSALESDNRPVLSHEETDILLQQVVEQITLNTFDVNDHAVITQLIECLGDTRGMTRLRAAETLGEIGEPATPFLIQALLNHANVVVRRAAAKTLTLIGDPDAVPSLIHAMLNDEDTVVNGSAAGALARTGEAAAPELLSILGSPDHSESIKGHAAWALAFMGSEAEPYLYQALSSDSSEVRAAVIGAIAKVIQEKSEDGPVDILINALDDPAEIVRSEAAAVLGNLAHTPAVPKLIPLLQHSEWETRKSAALSLMKIGDKTALPALQATLEKESDEAAQRILQLAISQLDKHQDDDW